ncbi:uncharacterized protein BT62DRAFT_990212 [Guyanagaster necrorhizus]|uniref:Uncharacterized protein n=1 Tax=Guyanagaster necrorhizus TaxID=856835 RepID=A0A9P7W4E0_9AGAR|nr:uncharacterized protein BT62DRAFT_990212 [Guyanagaster necrorhizus MCA 3950]KAG7451755.1 hypothetical protein BT62DRAFT_990212 [Guyanagaster necrorhizus MCA 3950]
MKIREERKRALPSRGMGSQEVNEGFEYAIVAGGPALHFGKFESVDVWGCNGECQKIIWYEAQQYGMHRYDEVSPIHDNGLSDRTAAALNTSQYLSRLLIIKKVSTIFSLTSPLRRTAMMSGRIAIEDLLPFRFLAELPESATSAIQKNALRSRNIVLKISDSGNGRLLRASFPHPSLLLHVRLPPGIAWLCGQNSVSAMRT